MLIAISGSQGSGKSTLVDRLAALGYKTVQRKTSRSIMKEWGVTLQQVNSDNDLTLRFQDEILKRKFEDEQEAVASSEIYITERTFADFFTYALITLGKDNTFSTWLNEYYDKCHAYNQHFHHTVYLKSGLFPLEHDGVRGSNEHYSRMVHVTMLDVTRKMIHTDKLTVVGIGQIDARVDVVNWLIKQRT